MKVKLVVLTGLLLLASVLAAQTQAPSEPNQQPAVQDTKLVPQDVTPSLADIARTKATKKASHVFTNDEIPSRPEQPAAEPAKDSAVTDTDKSAATAANPEDKKKKEEEESVEVKGARKVVEAKTIQIDAVIEEMHKLEFKLANAATPDEASIISQQIRNLQHNIEVWKNVRGDAQKVIDSAQTPKDKVAQAGQ